MGKLPTQTYFDIPYKKIDAEALRSKLKLRHFELKKSFGEKYPHAEKFFKEKALAPEKIREHSAKLIGAGIVAGSLFLLPPQDGIKLLPTPAEVVGKLAGDGDKKSEEEGKSKLLIDTLSSTLPSRPRPLSRSEEKFLEQIFQNIYGISTKASLEGEHLNTVYGYIGMEQHLRRFPGDKLAMHGEGEVLKEGLAPGLSAWGYFANSKDELTEESKETEKWYAVVQTLYLRDWNSRQPYLKNWYKHRKVFIVNTENGKGVVAAIADSGPAAWTGKQFGGSPEVMNYLGGERYKKGKVLIFFVDDPENKVSLGPVNMMSEPSSVIASR